MLTFKRLKEALHYDPDSGVFTWIGSTRRGFNGKVAGSKRSDGYWAIKIDDKSYYGHILAWFYMTGSVPKQTIDHRDLNKLNNAWLNLREATQGEQCCNRPIPKNNTSGAKGVIWSKRHKAWRGRVIHKKHVHDLGYFTDFEEAKSAVETLRKKLHGEFFQ